MFLSFKEFVKVVSINSKIVVKDNCSGTVLFSGYVPSMKVVDSFDFKNRDICLITSEWTEEGSYICVVLF